MNYQKIRPLIHNQIKEFISDTNNLDIAAYFSQGPIHIIFPDIFQENIHKFLSFYKLNWLNDNIYFAHKTNKSHCFLEVALNNNISIDVASKNELIHSLSTGFTWKNISCSWPKSQDFLFLAMKHKCLISIDNIDELKSIIDIYSSGNFPEVEILIRINDLSSSDRIVSSKNTKFWISQHLLPEIYNLLYENKFLNFKWLHFHFDEHQFELKAGSLQNAIDILQQSYELWFAPNIIDIWWGLRGNELLDISDWKKYIDFLAETKKNNWDTHTWWNSAYWVHVSQKWVIEWREIVEKRFRELDPIEFLNNILNFQTHSWNIWDTLIDSMFDLMIEPGYSLTLWCGFTLLKVIGYKDLWNQNSAVIVNANILNLSSKMWKYFVDPIHIQHKKNNNNTHWEFYWYIFWNLCRDDDILMQKKVYFKNKPEIWDYILFMNTSSYISDFEDGSAISQETWIKLIAKKDNNNTFKIYPD